MATRIEAFQRIVPAGTLESSPVDFVLDFVPATVTQIQILIPPGPSGLVGFAFIHSGQQVIPFRAGEFLIAEGETITWDVERFPSGRGWILRAFNEDIYSHTLFIRMQLNDGVAEGTATGVTIEEVDLSELEAVS